MYKSAACRRGTPPERKRIDFFDLWRSLAIVLMLAYHLLYDLRLFGVVDADVLSSPWAHMLQWLSAASFFLISGAVSRYSQNGFKRGLIVLVCGMLVSLVMYVMAQPVQFGVLHALGTLMIAYAALSPNLPLPQKAWFPLFCIAVFAATAYIGAHIHVETELLLPLGLHWDDFLSGDYYPLLPWGMAFAAGVWLGSRLEGTRLLSLSFPRILTFAGRHSLVIYLLHQPLFYGACLLLFS